MRLTANFKNFHYAGYNSKSSSVFCCSSGNLVGYGDYLNGMLKNHALAKSIADASFSEFHRQLKYKAIWHGGQVIEAARFYPSSKTCSRCGTVKDTLSLSTQIFVCDECGLVIDRDQNAAINLQHHTVSSTEIHACGDGRLQSSATYDTCKKIFFKQPNNERKSSILSHHGACDAARGM